MAFFSELLERHKCKQLDQSTVEANDELPKMDR